MHKPGDPIRPFVASTLPPPLSPPKDLAHYLKLLAHNSSNRNDYTRFLWLYLTSTRIPPHDCSLSPVTLD